MLEAIEIARHKQDVTNMLKACDYFMELLEMKPTKKIVTDTLQLDMSSSIAEAIESEENTITLMFSATSSFAYRDSVKINNLTGFQNTGATIEAQYQLFRLAF